VIVAIVVIATLIGLLSIGLRSTRAGSQQAAMMALGRQHAAVLAMYTSGYRDQFPFLVDPWIDPPTMFVSSDGRTFDAKFCDTVYAWNIALADEFYGGDSRAGVFASRGHRRGYWANFAYPVTFTTRPEFWDLRSRQAAPIQFAPTTSAEVAWPSQKALVVEALLVEDPFGVEALGGAESPVVVFVDGHGASYSNVNPVNAGPGLPPHELVPRWALVIEPWFGPFNKTADGVRGRDVQ
jgi:hypothetical protein